MSDKKSLIIIENTVLRTEIGDITKIGTMEAIVNSSNTKLANSIGGVNEKIHLAAGPELLAECQKLGGCKVGEAKITSAYNLHCKKLIHTVGPTWNGGKQNEAELLRACYVNSLALAVENNIQKTAFPSISTGLYGFPIKNAADIAVQSVADFIHDHHGMLKDVVWVLYDSYTKSYYDAALAEWEMKHLILKDKIFRKTNGIISNNNIVKKETIGTDSKKNPFEKVVKKQKQVEVAKVLHCVEDMHLLSSYGIKKVLIKGQHALFPMYYCPHCDRKYTSIDTLKDLLRINLSGVSYLNILEENDRLRLQEYLRVPLYPENGSKCYVYKTKPTECPVCKKGDLQHKKIKYLKKGKKESFYNAKYCEHCRRYFMHYSIYAEHADGWILENPEEYTLLLKPVKAGTIVIEYKKDEEKKEAKPEKEHDNNIHVKDFVVRRNTFKCMHNDHKLKDIAGTVGVITQKGEVKQLKISAGYCPQCNIFFILESTYDYLKSRGTPLCRISSEKAYLKGIGSYNGMKLAQESILMQHGYNVSQEEALSPIRRQKILAVLIDNKVLTKNDVIGYLDFFISQKKSNPKFEKAISKWQDDREFVARYKIGAYKQYSINGILYKY